MKIVLLLLLLANVVFLLAWQGGLGVATRAAVVPEQREPSRVLAQVHADKVEVLTALPAEPAPVAPPALSTAPGAAESAPAATGAAVPAAALAPASGPAPAATLACLEIGPLAEPEAARLADRLRTAKLAGAVEVRAGGESTTYMVYLPPLSTRAEADRKVAELRAKGVSELFVIQEPAPMRNAISLGVFRSTEAATHQVETLAARGIKGVKVQSRTTTGGRARVEARDVPPGSRAIVDRLGQDHAGTAWRECAAPVAEAKAASAPASKR